MLKQKIGWLIFKDVHQAADLIFMPYQVKEKNFTTKNVYRMVQMIKSKAE